MKGYEEITREDARLIILKSLAKERDYSLNETILDAALVSFGHSRSRDWVRTQLHALEDLGAITLIEAGSVMIATINQPGLDHVQMRATLEGVLRPSPGR